MSANKPAFGFVPAGLALLICGCSLGRKAPASAGSAAGRGPVSTDSLTGGRKDSAATLEARLLRVDSVEAPSQKATYNHRAPGAVPVALSNPVPPVSE
jgi:hypothetical protein